MSWAIEHNGQAQGERVTDRHTQTERVTHRHTQTERHRRSERER